MTASLSIVDAPGGSTLFSFQDAAGTQNPHGMIARFARESTIDMGMASPDMIEVPFVRDGGQVVLLRNPLTRIRFDMLVQGTMTQILDGLGYVGNLLSKGGWLAWTPDGTFSTRYIPFEPSPQLAAFVQQQQVLELAQRSPIKLPDIAVEINRQPWSEGTALLPTVNKAVNSTLVMDYASPANRPDNWTLDSATGISAESIASGVDWGYKFTIADAAAHNWTQTTAVASFAPGDVVTMSFYAKVDAVAGTPQMQATVLFKQSDGTTSVGTQFNGGLVTLTTSWQRISVTTTAAGALTSRAIVGFQMDNADATSVTVRVRMVQPEVAATPSLFRVGVESVAYDPASTTSPRIPVFCQGNAPAMAKAAFTSDSNGLALARLARETLRPIETLKSVLFKQLESGTLGGDTTSQADGNASGGNYARWLPTATDPAMASDASGGGASDTINVTRPSGVAVGDILEVRIWRAQATTVVAAPTGWKIAGVSGILANTFGITSSLWVFWKIADASDVAATSYTFTVVFPGGGTTSYRYWIGRLTNVDNASPFAASPVFSSEANTTSPTAVGLTTDSNNALIIVSYSGNNSAGALSFTVPAGTTPTFTEQDDGTADVTFRGMAVDTGVLATAGATGNKDSTSAIAIDSVQCMTAYRKAPSALAVRSTVTWSAADLPALGSYEVWLRYMPDAASAMRIRVEWATKPSPTIWNKFEDLIVDSTGASSFAYCDHKFGRLFLPDDNTFDTLTIRVSVGIESGAIQNWRGDFIRLVKADESVGQMIAQELLVTSEVLVGDASTDRAFSLSTASKTKAPATVDGPVPIELLPGLNLIDPIMLKTAATGFQDRLSVLGSVHTLAVTHSPRYRTG